MQWSLYSWIYKIEICKNFSFDEKTTIFFDFSSPEDYEILLRLDERVQRKTVNTSVLNSLPNVVADEKYLDEICSICIENYLRGQTLKILPCSHVFHSDCIEKYLQEFSIQCPLDNLPLMWLTDHQCDRLVFINKISSTDTSKDIDVLRLRLQKGKRFRWFINCNFTRSFVAFPSSSSSFVFVSF